jgi:hypothetical protein
VKLPDLRIPLSLKGTDGTLLSPAATAQRFVKQLGANHKARGAKPTISNRPAATNPNPECGVTASEVVSAIKSLKTKQAADTPGLKPEFF